MERARTLVARANNDSAKAVDDNGFRRVLRRNLIPSARYGAPRTRPGLSGNFVPPAVTQLVGTANALACGMHPPRKRACVDGDLHPRYSLSSRQSCARRDPARPEVSLCLDCLGTLLEPELAAHPGRVVAFEPDGESFTQYFFVGLEDFAAAGLRPEVAAAIEKRIETFRGACGECGGPATWLWISRREVSCLDQTERIEESPGAMYCAKHGAAKFARGPW